MEDIQLDRTDLRLLAILQAEGRIANTDLAERINLSASASQPSCACSCATTTPTPCAASAKT